MNTCQLCKLEILPDEPKSILCVDADAGDPLTNTMPMCGNKIHMHAHCYNAAKERVNKMKEGLPKTMYLNPADGGETFISEPMPVSDAEEVIQRMNTRHPEMRFTKVSPRIFWRRQ